MGGISLEIFLIPMNIPLQEKKRLKISIQDSQDNKNYEKKIKTRKTERCASKNKISFRACENLFPQAKYFAQ
jgi:hypothetical protein